MDGAILSPFSAGIVRPAGGSALPRDALARAMHQAAANFGWSSPAKWFAKATRRTPKAMQRLLDAENSPNVETLIALCRDFDECWAAFRALCGRDPADAEEMLDRFAAMLRERRQIR